jgi:hypothetical protein
VTAETVMKTVTNVARIRTSTAKVRLEGPRRRAAGVMKG